MKKIIILFLLMHNLLFANLVFVDTQPLLFSIDEKRYVQEKLKSEAALLDYYLNKEEIVTDDFYIKNETIFFELLDRDDVTKLQILLKQKFKTLIVNETQQIYKLTLTPIQTKALIDKSVESLQRAFKEYGVYPVDSLYAKVFTLLGLMPELRVDISKTKNNEVSVEIKNLRTQEERDSIMALLSYKSFELYKVMEQEKNLKISNKYLNDVDEKYEKYLVKSVPVLTTDMIKYAQVHYADKGRFSLILICTALGKEILADFTSINITKRMALSVNNKVYIAPTIMDEILEGKIEISATNLELEALHRLVSSLNVEFSIPLIRK